MGGVLEVRVPQNLESKDLEETFTVTTEGGKTETVTVRQGYYKHPFATEAVIKVPDIELDRPFFGGTMRSSIHLSDSWPDFEYYSYSLQIIFDDKFERLYEQGYDFYLDLGGQQYYLHDAGYGDIYITDAWGWSSGDPKIVCEVLVENKTGRDMLGTITTVHVGIVDGHEDYSLDIPFKIINSN